MVHSLQLYCGGVKTGRNRSRLREVSRSLFVFGWQDETDIQMCNRNRLYRLKGRWIRLPNPLLLVRDPLLALPCKGQLKCRGFCLSCHKFFQPFKIVRITLLLGPRTELRKNEPVVNTGLNWYHHFLLYALNLASVMSAIFSNIAIKQLVAP